MNTSTSGLGGFPAIGLLSFLVVFRLVWWLGFHFTRFRLRRRHGSHGSSWKPYGCMFFPSLVHETVGTYRGQKQVNLQQGMRKRTYRTQNSNLRTSCANDVEKSLRSAALVGGWSFRRPEPSREPLEAPELAREPSVRELDRRRGAGFFCCRGLGPFSRGPCISLLRCFKHHL